MKVVFVIVGFLLIRGALFAQGVKFEEGLIWEQVKAKAKAENKNIFLDCYASWCAPCKWMDKEVYPNDTIGRVLNRNFISVKVQFDTSAFDTQNVKQWYEDANLIKSKYRISAYPTFLFLSSGGELLYKEIGARDIASFIKMVNDAGDSGKQYDVLIKAYHQKELTYTEIADLAKKSAEIGNKEESKEIADDYIDNYLAHLSKRDRFTEDNIEFLGMFTTGSKDRSFRLLYNSRHRIARVMSKNPYYVSSIIEYWISKEEVEGYLFRDGKLTDQAPDWVKIKKNITRKYNKYYADKLTLNGLQRYAAGKKRYDEYLQYVAKYLDRYSSEMGNYEINKYSWIICQYSIDTKSVATAARVMQKVVRTETDSTNFLPAFMDTYANLLYRLGKKEQAITIEKMAEDHAETEENGLAFRDVIEKMKRDEKMWPVEVESHKLR